MCRLGFVSTIAALSLVPVLALAQPKPPTGAATTPPVAPAGAVQVAEGSFSGPLRDGKPNGKGQLMLRSGLVVEDAEYREGNFTGFVVCNSGDAASFTAIAWRDGDDWTSKGWYRIDPKKCNTLWPGRLDRRYVAYRVEFEGKERVGGELLFCMHPTEGFDMKNSAACPTGGVRRGFALADLGEGQNKRLGAIVETGGGAAVVVGGGGGAAPPVVASATGTLELTDGTYTGAIRDGKPWGKGVIAYKDGGRLEAEFVDGKANGAGSLFDRNKNKWIGTFKDGLLQGKVRVEWSDGTVLDPADMEGGRIVGFAFCNPRDAAVFGAVGYRNGEAWTAKGWYKADAKQCVYLRSGNLDQRNWYYRFVAGDTELKGGEYKFCVHPTTAFEMNITEPCPTGGTMQGFAEYDLGEGTNKRIGVVLDAPK